MIQMWTITAALNGRLLQADTQYSCGAPAKANEEKADPSVAAATS
jgi:hypothetical protein